MGLTKRLNGDSQFDIHFCHQHFIPQRTVHPITQYLDKGNGRRTEDQNFEIHQSIKIFP